MARKRDRQALLQPGEVDIVGASKLTGFTVSSLRTYYNKLKGEQRPPFEKRNGVLVATESEMSQWQRRWDEGEFAGAFARVLR